MHRVSIDLTMTHVSRYRLLIQELVWSQETDNPDDVLSSLSNPASPAASPRRPSESKTAPFGSVDCACVPISGRCT